MQILFVYIFLSLLCLSYGSHSLWTYETYIKGQTPFPEFSSVTMLDDIRVLYYNGDTNTFIPRGNTTAEDNVYNSKDLLTISEDIKTSFIERWTFLKKYFNVTDGVFALQALVVCELRDDGEQGRLIARSAFRGSTTDELLYVDKNFTYKSAFNVSDTMEYINLEYVKHLYETLYQPFCFKTLKRYLEKRKTQIYRKEKPKVRLLQNQLESGFRVTCLATGFYPRHLNLSLFRDGQPVSDHEVTGGDLLPNGDGTYQKRKSLEIRGDERHKHTYSCSATHLSMTVDLEFDHGESFKAVIASILTVLALMLVFGAAVIIWRKWHRGSGENVEKKPYVLDQKPHV